MNCAVCGKKFGFFTRTFGTDADDGVCKDCEETGANRLRLVLNRCGPKADFAKLQEELDELVARYQILPENAGRAKADFVEGMAAVLAGEDELKDADIELFNKVCRDYGAKVVNVTSALGRSVLTINARQAITGWEKGEAPHQQCRGLLLEAGEICHWQEPAQLLEQRSRREYFGGSQGVSVRLMRGLTYRVGAFKGHSINTTYLADAGPGTLHITSKRIAFTGTQQAVSVPFKKIISISGFEDALQIFRTGAKRPTILCVTHPELTLQILAFATPAAND